MTSRPALVAIGLLLLAGGSAAQTGSLTASLTAPSMGSFATLGPQSPFAVLENVLRTEPVTISLTTQPTIPNPPPAQLQPRRVQLWLGRLASTPIVFPEGSVWIDFGASPFPVVLIDSFSNPFAPTFGPPLQGLTNTISFTIAANLFPPQFLLSSTSPLCLQAICEDTNSAILISNPVPFTLVDPIGPLAPTITDINPKTLSGTQILRPSGPESGGNIVTLTGTNFPSQTNWIQFPPTVLFGAVPATNIVVLSRTTLQCTVPPAATPTVPPNTSACLVQVSLINNPLISPLGVAATSPIPYLYLSGFTPSPGGFDIPNGTPEGGQIRTIIGSAFLNGLSLTFTSLNNPGFQTTIFPALTDIGPGGQSITFTTPPFCTGIVTVKVTNCDEVESPLIAFNYDPIQPTIASVAPTITLDPSLGGGTFPWVDDIGSALTITGTGYLTSGSPLATAPTVPPGSFYPTRIFIDQQLQPGVAPTNPTTLVGTTNNVDAPGEFRPALGFKTLVIENSPCVAPPNTGPIQNPPCAPGVNLCTVLRRDTAAPTLSGISPSVASLSGCNGVRLTGQNFFSVQSNVRTQDFGAPGSIILSIPAQSLVVPAVRIGNRFATRVTLISETELIVDFPPGATPPVNPTQVTVFNPDGQPSNTQAITYAPTLTDPSKLTFAGQPGLESLNAASLNLIAQTATAFDSSSGPNTPPAIILIENPSPSRDADRDNGNGNIPANTSYDYVFLLNTLADGPGPLNVRHFNFNQIDLPSTIDLVAGQKFFKLRFDVASAPGSLETLTQAFTARVIIKATGFRLSATGLQVIVNPPENHPLFLQSHGDFVIDSMINLSGESFFLDDLNAANGSSFGGPFRVRVDRTFAPAGAGRGGRGGAFFPEGLAALAGPNFGVSNVVLRGGTGEIPPSRFAPTIPTSGSGGFGNSPVGIQAGGGGGAGSVGPGANGTSGTAPGGFGGVPFGNLTSNTIVPAPIGTPTDDRLIFGSIANDFLAFFNETSVGTGLIYGGSGGGGGGGSLAIFVPAETLGGRGGHGGGCMILLSDCVLTLGPAATLLANGEQGQLGVDLFPVLNAAPTIPLNIPGAGGGGSGGTILALAVSNIVFANAPQGTPCTNPGSPSTGFAVADVSGGLGGPPGGQQGVGSIAGGTGAAGRIRFAVNGNNSGPLLTTFTQAFEQLVCIGLVKPVALTQAPVPAGFFVYPSP